MFERYTEKARRVIFFARYEASQFGSPHIETEHLLLGMVREDKALTNRFLRSNASFELMRRQVEQHTTVREAVSTSVDLPISNECKRVLAYAAEEAERLGHKHIGTEHLLLGLLREDKSFAAELLRERGVQLPTVREELARLPQVGIAHSPGEATLVSAWFRDLTQLAGAGQLDSVVGRDLEIDAVIEILCCSFKQNALLIGARGAGKMAIVEGLAQRIAYGKAPSYLAGKKILALKAEVIRSGPRDRHRLEELMATASGGLNLAETMVFFDELQSYSDDSVIIKRVLLRTGIQCIGAMHIRDESELTRARSWSEEWFQAVHVGSLNEENALAVLTSRKMALEAFHGVTYSHEALQFAVHAAAGYLSENALPGKAVELLDAAGSHVKLHQGEPPREVAEVEIHLRSIIDRLEKAIANHEFEKARYYSEEEHKEREKLQEVREKYHLGDAAAPVVSPDDLKEVIARWAAYPYRP